MEVSIKYFGLIAEKIGVASEVMELTDQIESNELLEIIKNKHPGIAEIPFKLAVNQELIIQKTKILADTEIALLPAYAGG